MKISIAMTTFNGARFLRQQLDSISAQSRLPDELVICDDQSTDETMAIVQDYRRRAPFPVRVEINDERLGSTRNFEKAIELCTGDVIALCDQDDVWRRQKLLVIEAEFLADAEVGAVITNADLIDDHGSPLRGDLWSRSTLNKERQRALATPRRYDLLLGFPFTTGATMAFRGRFKPLLLPFPTNAPTFIHDRWISSVIGAVSGLSFVDEKLVAYRVHRQQQLGLGKMPLACKIFVPHRCWSDAAGLAALHDRLVANPAFSANAEFWRSLADRRDHVAARLRYSRNPVRRLGQIIKEYRVGRYARFPHGRAIVLQDFLAGTR